MDKWEGLAFTSTRNLERLSFYFNKELGKMNYEGLIGVAAFNYIYNDLMPVQRDRLMDLTGGRVRALLEGGSVVCIGIAYPQYAIDSINVLVDGVVDKGRWNIYAREYQEINERLDALAESIANRCEGRAIAATLGGLVGKVAHVKEYYPLTISHRVVAENAGLGWRGKNELIVNERYGCAIRFASIITELPLPHGRRPESRCGACRACLEACALLKNKEGLVDYRESCRKFIQSLALEHEVCGKCIAACHRRGAFKDIFALRKV
jgi:epoxyqueuosine reductase QueG